MSKAPPRPFGRAWSRGNSEAGLLGFVDPDDKMRFDRGENGPFRRVIAPGSWGTPSRQARQRAAEEARRRAAEERLNG